MNKLIEELFPEANMTAMDIIRTERPDIYGFLISMGYEIYISDNVLMVKDSTGDVDVTLELFLAIAKANQTT